MTDRFDDWKPPEMIHNVETKWHWLPYHPENIKIGKNVDIGAYCFLQGGAGIIIEDDVQIGSHTSIYSEDSERGIVGLIVIKKGILIGSHVTILPREHIHVINKNIKAGCIIY